MQRVVVLDTETSGDGPTDRVVELATVELPGWRTCSMIVDPEVPISVEARAVHHITDEEIAGAPKLRDLRPWSEDAVHAAHNMGFDARILLQSGAPLPDRRLCTWRCSMHLWPDAPSYKNQALRYWLNVRVPDEAWAEMRRLHPHRALYDAIVTAGILQKMLETHSVDDLVGLTSAPVLLKTIRFGVHRGKLWSEVPEGYLRWILRQGQKQSDEDDEGFDKDVVHTARHWMENRS